MMMNNEQKNVFCVSKFKIRADQIYLLPLRMQLSNFLLFSIALCIFVYIVQRSSSLFSAILRTTEENVLFLCYFFFFVYYPRNLVDLVSFCWLIPTQRN